MVQPFDRDATHCCRPLCLLPTLLNLCVHERLCFCDDRPMDPDLRVSVQLSEPSRYCASAGITSQAGEQVLRRPGSRSRSRDLSLRLARPLLPSGYAVHSSRDRHTVAIAKQAVQFRDPHRDIRMASSRHHRWSSFETSRCCSTRSCSRAPSRPASPRCAARAHQLQCTVLDWTGLYYNAM